MKTYAVIVAGGVGERMGRAEPKQFLPLAGEPIIARSIAVFESTGAIDAIVVVSGRESIERTQAIVREKNFRKVVAVVPGGSRRQLSVWEGLQAIEPPCDVVAIHDAVRPLVTPEIVTQSVLVARNFGGALVACPVTSTIKIISDDGFVRATPERRTLVAAQTPQTFSYSVLMRAYREAVAIDFRATDDSQVVERLGAPVVMVKGSEENLKITTPTDLVIAEAIFARRKLESGDGA